MHETVLPDSDQKFMSPPAVSICIPTFDRLAFLQEAVTSARAQSLANIEIVISDDGHSTGLRDWCLSQVAVDGRVRYYKTPRRLGLAGNWNFLANMAAGDFLVLMGDDDRLLPCFVERLLATADADVVFSNHYLIDENGRRLHYESQLATRRYSREGLRPGAVEDPQMTVWKNSVPMSSSIVRTSEVRRLGFKEDINTPELELFVRLASDGGRFVFVGDYLAEYRVHAGSETSTGLKIDRLAEYLEQIDVSAKAEPIKRALVGAMLVRGVGIRLARGDVPGARALRASRSYPRVDNFRSLAQRLLLALPDAKAAAFYKFLLSCRQALRKRVPGR
jgi:glycosyltransferase involved in cell wall biosynthesis